MTVKEFRSIANSSCIIDIIDESNGVVLATFSPKDWIYETNSEFDKCQVVDCYTNKDHIFLEIVTKGTQLTDDMIRIIADYCRYNGINDEVYDLITDFLIELIPRAENTVDQYKELLCGIIEELKNVIINNLGN